ncbi:hypothetical protein JRQ81_019880 [Phrynocephalus forsythii]|uniref:EF-hand domain-containing protein n=1 Tax=Phrynocephalus forsythii TaxID=171643 RepID=A0A9Q0XN99_9SAUR|nr:hypothetical protein JRQ81_019880 [Phrynocephalus forsythii]
MGASDSKEDFATLDNPQWYAKFMKECPSGQLSIFECKKMIGIQDATPEANSYIEKVFNIFDTNRNSLLPVRSLQQGISIDVP